MDDAAASDNQAALRHSLLIQARSVPPDPGVVKFGLPNPVRGHGSTRKRRAETRAARQDVDDLSDSDAEDALGDSGSSGRAE